MSTQDEQVRQEFDEVVNMSPSLLDQWLDSDASRSLRGDPPAHELDDSDGRRVVDVMRTPQDELNDVDHAFMRRVVAEVRRLLEQGPGEDAERWRWSLMDWGHDPQQPAPAGTVVPPAPPDRERESAGG